MLQIDDTFNGREVILEIGQMLEVSLSENASTGFRWEIPAELQHQFTNIIQERDHAFRQPDGPPGKPGSRLFHFEAVQPGEGELELHYRRSWESAKSPARKFTLRVIVRSPSVPD